MRCVCKLCNGRGKQKNSLRCNCCKGKGFFDLTGKIAKQCNSCKGTGRASIRTLPCISCSGKGFSVLSEATGAKPFQAAEIKAPKKEELKIPKIATVPKVRITKKSGRKKTVVEEEFGEEHLDSLQEKLTEVLEQPW